MELYRHAIDESKVFFRHDDFTSHRRHAAGPSRGAAARVRRVASAPSLNKGDAENYAEWFALLADPTRVRLLHTLSTSPAGRDAHR